MKINGFFLLFALLVVSFFSCQQEKSQERSETNFDWVLGDWQRSNDEAGKTTYEYWKKESNKEYIGLGCTLFAGDTIFRENLKINRRKGAWWLVVTGTDNNPVSFRIVSVKKAGLNAENPDNEFPKYIKYRLEGDQLKAIVADDSNEIEFNFKQL